MPSGESQDTNAAFNSQKDDLARMSCDQNEESGVIEVSADDSLPPDRQIAKLKRFLVTIFHFSQLSSTTLRSSVKNLIKRLVEGDLEPGDFFNELQGSTKFPLRPYVVPFLHSSLPLLRAKYNTNSSKNDLWAEIFEGEESIQEGSSTDVSPCSPPDRTRKRKLTTPSDRSEVITKRLHTERQWSFNGQSVSRNCSTTKQSNGLLMEADLALRDLASSASSSLLNKPSSQTNTNTIGNKNNNNAQKPPLDLWAWYSEEWRHIENLFTTLVSTMDRLRYSLILFQQKVRLSHSWTQQQQNRRDSNTTIEEVQRKADVVVQEVKRAALLEMQKAVSLAEEKAINSVNAERNRWERIFRDFHKQQNSTDNCWNCGRKAGQTCSGCGIARYCGVFCQHKDWEKHSATCCTSLNSTNKSSQHREAIMAIKREQPSPPSSSKQDTNDQCLSYRPKTPQSV